MKPSKAARQRARAILSRLQGIHKPVVVEVGVANGQLSQCLLEAHKGITLYMVDSWATEWPESYRNSGDRVTTLTPEQQEERYRQAYQVAQKGLAHIVRKDSVEAANVIPNNLDLVFLDADHSYEGVKRDIQAWWRKVKKGGYLSGHDYANPDFDFGVKQAVDEYFTPELGENYTWFVRRS